MSLMIKLWCYFYSINIGPRTKIKYLTLLSRPKGELKIGSDCVISCKISYDRNEGKINIGDNCFIGQSHLIAANSIVIENDVIISWGVTIVDHNSHSMFSKDRKNDVIDWEHGQKDWTNVKIKSVTVKQGAWIGFNASILKGVTIGKNAIVGANSVVTKDVPEGSIVAGNPARVIRKKEDKYE
jgi:acetyltransferase-like isoleucine patch superfamily enzyme